MAESPAELQAEIEKLERKHLENPEGRYFVPLANAYRKIGEIENAEELLREGLRRHPEYLSAHIVLGRCFSDRNAQREAIDEFKYVLTLDPQNLIALRTLGELAVVAGDRQDATRWYRELLAVDPMNEEARRALESLAAAPDALPGEMEARSERSAARSQVEEPGASEAIGEMSAAEFRSSTPFSDAEDADAEVSDAEGIDVVTETIAELYTRQGLHDRAIEVYRELIRRRGADEGLERRLREVQEAREMERSGGASRGAAAVAPDAEHPLSSGEDAEKAEPVRETSWLDALDGEPRLPADALAEPVRVDQEAALPHEAAGNASALEQPSADDPFAESFAEGFDIDRGFDAERFAAPVGFESSSSMAGAEEAEDSYAGFSLLDDEDARDEEPTTFAGLDPGSQPSTGSGLRIAEQLGALAAWRPTAPSGDSGAQTEVLPATKEDPDLEAAPAGGGDKEAEAPSPEDQVGMGPADEELFPWELGEPAAEAPEIAESTPKGFDPFAYEGFDEGSGAQARRQPEPEGPAEPAAGPDAGASAAGQPTEGAEEEGDDDDLESFQAWLRSLKR